jgi:hypothetical protein
MNTEGHSMDDAHKIAEISVFTKSTEPRTGVALLRTVEAEIRFEITEDLAHRICTELERFLTR